MIARLYLVTSPKFRRPQYHLMTGDPAGDEANFAQVWRAASAIETTLIATTPEGADEWSPDACLKWVGAAVRRHREANDDEG